MANKLGVNQYGKAESRVVRIVRDTPRHEIRDLNVSTSLRGDFEDAHITGDQAAVLPTDTQKNTAFAYAKLHGVSSIEDYGLALGRRLLEACPAASAAQVRVEEFGWDRIGDHSFVRRGGAVRTCVVTVGRDEAIVLSGISDLVVLNSTDSEFKGFLKDEFTTLPEADDRVLATSLVAKWRHTAVEGVDWNASYAAVLQTLLETFAGDLLARAAGDVARDGVRGARRPAGDRRDQVLRAQQASLPRRLQRLPGRRADQRRRGLHRRRPALRPDRGTGDPRRRATGGRRLAARARLLLMADVDVVLRARRAIVDGAEVVGVRGRER